MATLYLLHMNENSQYLQPYTYSAGYFVCLAGGGPFEWGLQADRQSALRTRGKARSKGACLLYPHPGFVPKASSVILDINTNMDPYSDRGGVVERCRL